jgi:hypothetical protein
MAPFGPAERFKNGKSLHWGSSSLLALLWHVICHEHTSPKASESSLTSGLLQFHVARSQSQTHNRPQFQHHLRNFAQQLTKQQKDGFISKQWHLSHLCGNWTCLNPAHTTVEAGSVNISRNNCFSHRSGCGYTPQCIKDRKVPLGADGRQVNPMAPTVNEGSQAMAEQIDWDDWRQDFDDEEFMVVDDTAGSESMATIANDIDTGLQV